MTQSSESQNTGWKIFLNSFSHLGGIIASNLLSLLANIQIIRSLGSEAYGHYSFVYIFLSFFETFVDFGLNTILTRETAQNRAEAPKILGNALIIRIALSCFSILVAWCLVSILPYPKPVRFGIYLASFQLFLGLRAIHEIIFRVNLAMGYPAFWNTLRGILHLAMITFLVFFSHTGIEAFILLNTAGGLLAWIGLWHSSKKFIRLQLRPDFQLMKRLLHAAFPLLASSYLTLLYSRVDFLMLFQMRSAAEVGQYTAVIRITEMLGLLSSSFMVSIAPLLAESFKKDPEKFSQIIKTSFKWLLLASLPIAVGGLFTGRDLIILLYGADYVQASKAFQYLLVASIFNFLGNLLVNILYACHKQIVDTQVSVIMLIVSAVLNFLLIPHFGYTGSAFITLFNTFLGCALMFWHLQRTPHLSLPVSECFRITILSLTMNVFFGLILAGWKHLFPSPVLVLILTGIFFYTLLLTAFKQLPWKKIARHLTSPAKP